MPDHRPSASSRGYGSKWRELRAKQPHTPCATCGAPWRFGFHLDHIKARAKGGTDHPSNLQWLCPAHHSVKTAQKDGSFGRESRRIGCDEDGWPVGRSS